MKKLFLPYLLFALCCYSANNSLHAEYNDLCDTESSSGNNLFDPGEELPGAEQPFFQEACVSPELLLSLLSEFNILNVLQQNLYLRTNPVISRNLLDLPSLQPYYFYNDNLTFTIQPFYNQTRLMHLNESCPFISSYIALQDTALTDLLQEIVDELNESFFDTPIINNIPEVLGLFKNIKLEERRGGFMFGIAKQWNYIHFSILAPIYYSERNFFLTNAEIDNIQNAPFFRQDGTTPEKDETEAQAYFKRHLLSDRFGIGDTRVNLEAHVFHGWSSDAWFGLQSTIPTGGTFKKGMIGGCFDKLACTPNFNLLELAQCFNQSDKFDEYLQDGTQFIEGALDRLTTILADAPLGNGGFFGIGPRLDFTHYINYNWSLYTYLAYQHYFENSQVRFFLARKNPAEFDRDLTAEGQEEANIAFLNQQIVNTFYPQRTIARVHPGDTFQIRETLILDTDCWHAALGVDYWRLSAERVRVCADACELEINKGLLPHAHQLKLYSSIGYFGVHNNTWYHVLGTVDGTVSNSGIGKDFTVGLRVGFEF